jgi:hypothetical protein
MTMESIRRRNDDTFGRVLPEEEGRWSLLDSDQGGESLLLVRPKP